MLHNVFVYGTLKSGQSNHPLLQGHSGQVAIAPNINLHAGPHYPFAVRGEGQTIGEMYEVNKTTLRKLDRLEGHPHDYKRELIPILLAEGQQIEAWIYLNQKAYRYPRILDGKWVGIRNPKDLTTFGKLSNLVPRRFDNFWKVVKSGTEEI
jgi:gamma-glutamylaminecyclotransferase